MKASSAVLVLLTSAVLTICSSAMGAEATKPEHRIVKLTAAQRRELAQIQKQMGALGLRECKILGSATGMTHHKFTGILGMFPVGTTPPPPVHMDITMTECINQGKTVVNCDYGPPNIPCLCYDFKNGTCEVISGR